MKLSSDIIRTLAERGFIKDATDLAGLDSLASAIPVRAYIGFDLTAPALHVGSLIQLMILRHLKAAGQEPIVLYGNATTRVGDPSDKDTARPVLKHFQILDNRKGITGCIDRIVGYVDTAQNNAWFDDLEFMDFITRYGPHFTVNRMLTMDSVKRRLDRAQPLTVLEFNYMLMQSIDFLELFERKGCMLQIGGSDQWSNILGGVDLVRRVQGKQVFGIVTPLLVDTAGKKMGKTVDGKTTWLDPTMTVPFDFWQFFRNVEDAKIGEFLGLFTDLPMNEIRRLAALQGAEINDAKRILATEVTAIVHGRDIANDVADNAAQIFGSGAVNAEVPTYVANHTFDHMNLNGLLVAAGLCSSNREANQIASDCGLKVAGHICTIASMRPREDMLREGSLLLQVGKKRIVRIIFQPEFQ